MREDLRMLPSDLEELRKKKRKIMALVAVTVIVSLSLFSIPVSKKFSIKKKAMKSALDLVSEINERKTAAIQAKKGFEMRFVLPNQIEVYEVESCANLVGAKLVERKSLSDDSEVVFVSEDWIRKEIKSDDTLLQGFCFDPVQGMKADFKNRAEAYIFLSHQKLINSEHSDPLVSLHADAASGHIKLE